MELREGYIQTEVGMIPGDWHVVPLSKLIASLDAGVSVNSVDEKLGFLGHNESVLKTSCISNGYFYPDECKKILPNDIKRAKLIPSKNSVIISRMNTPALVGECGYVDKDYPYLFLPDRLWQTTIKKDVGVNVRWLAYLLSFGQFSKAIKETATGTSGSMKNISKSIFLNLNVLFPSVKEQTAIAAALSDADALVQSLTSLIAKKRQIKQGAMQTLLAGEKRLPGFSGKWEVKCIGEFTDCTSGGTPSTLMSHYWNGQIRWMNSGELNLKNVYDVEGRITEKGLRNSSTKLLPPKCVLVGLAGQGKTRGTVAMNQIQLCTNQSIAAILPNAAFNSEYLYYNLDSRYRELRELSTGDGGRGGLNLTIIRSLKVSFPKLPEQAAIAAILSNMDTEINALETKLTKYQQIKHGMMQNLLTGRIRLI